ncbi:MAG TPA: sulfite exporter TauE/SafE family protein [Chthonomonadaceae bacterium]|nr:sulfite exporter TauE/SafE family protein [Chthonomonadaceae bacterium]
MPHLTPTQWLLGAIAALCIGMSKTGLPGVGVLIVPVMAALFDGRTSVGTVLPLLLFADCFAILWYRRHARWDCLMALAPWLLVGMAAGAGLLWILGEQQGHHDPMNRFIGTLVLVMLGVHLARLRWNDRLMPTSRLGVISVGGASGFATTVSNAAGPVMSIYMASLRLPKEQFMGTSAWFYFLVNIVKFPMFIVLTLLTPDKPLLTRGSLLFDLTLFPLILVGAFVGKWSLNRLSQRLFDSLILILAAVAAVKLLIG